MLKELFTTPFFVWMCSGFYAHLTQFGSGTGQSGSHERNRSSVRSLGPMAKNSQSSLPHTKPKDFSAFYTAENTILYYLALKARTGCASFSFWITIFTSLTVSPQMIKLVSQDEMQWLQNNELFWRALKVYITHSNEVKWKHSGAFISYC